MELIVKEFILELGRESGEFMNGIDDPDEYIKAVMDNSVFYDDAEPEEVFQKAANGDIASIIKIRKAWGLPVLR